MSERASTEQKERETATHLASKLHENMTFDEVSQFLQIGKSSETGAFEHGGIWVQVPVGERYYIQLRFKRSNGDEINGDSVLNSPPRVVRRSPTDNGK